MVAAVNNSLGIEVNDAVRVGIIGVGEAILEYSYPALRSLERKGNIKIVSISDKYSLDGTRCNLEKRRGDYPKEKDSIEDILKRFSNQDIKHYMTEGDRFNSSSNGVFSSADMFYLATPNNIRFRLVEQIAGFGKNLVVEKPAGHTSGVVNDITEVIRKSMIKGICAEHYSYKDPSLIFFRDFDERTKNFGKINFIEGFLVEDDFLEAERYIWLLDPTKSGGGIWLDNGCHMMHLLYSTGARLAEVVRAKSYRYPFASDDPRDEIAKSETAADVILRLRDDNGRVANNAYGHIRVAKCKPKSLKYFKICFDKGEVFLDYLNNSISYTDRSGSEPKFEHEMIPKTNPYENMLTRFLDYCKNGKEAPTVMNKIKASTDALFEVYGKMREGDPREFY